ncbi:MAG: AcrB/AcrD/AcrF family protein [Rhodobacterales bacterium CG15_BIG_FIL_POST_REV_8_21_14_020_59_13]|nr:MAG: AcrB/AcrD/AcrF family protein [Rhodobacterales bacterium CG15_BIG_FIL_POST_REV_8_21_14_020_59_13]
MTDPKQDTEFKGIIAWWASNGVAANLLMLVAIVGGILGLMTMNREVFPTANFAGATVSIAWPGASPQEMEEQIVVRIEEAVSSVDGIETLTSTAREGSASINIEGTRSVDMQTFINEIEQRVNSVNNLPPSAFRPIINQWRNEDQVVGFAVHGQVPRRDLQRIAREIRDEVSAEVPGVSLVQVWATLDEEVSIEVNENDLRRYALTFDEVARALRSSSLNASAGQVRTDIGDVSLTARQLGDSANDFENIVVRQTSDGGTLRISDIATVTDGFVDANLVGTFNGESMALVVIISSPNMDVVDVSNGVQDYIERRQATLPEGVSMSLWWNNAEAYEARVDTVMGSAIWGTIFVLIALILFLRPVVAFWVTVGIGVAFLGAFLVLPLLGVTLNMLSLFAFLIVIGIVVDDAIIVGENIHDRVEKGETGLTAAVVGTQMVMKPVIFAVITTILMFAPWMMLSGPEVQFTRQISLVVIAALTFSLIESLFILPAHLAHLKPENLDGFFGPFLKLQRAIADTMVWFARHVYRHAIVFAVQRRYSTLIFFTGIFALAIALQVTNRVGSVFMPEIENETIQASIQLAEGTPWQRTEQVRQQLERAEELTLDHYREVYPGAADMIESRSTLATDGRVRAWITLAEPEDRPGGLSTREVAQQLRDFLGPIPDAEEVRLDTTLNNGGNGLRFAISGQDLNELRLAADELKEQLRSYDTLYDVVDNMQSSAQELQFSLRPDAQSLGIRLSDVTRQVRQAFYGEEVVRLPRNGQDVRVMLRYPEDARRSLDTLRNFRIRTSDGREVPLAAVADVEFAPGLNRINRRDRMRTITVAAELTDPTARGEVMNSMDADFWPAWQERHANVGRQEFGQAEGEAEFMAELANLVILVLGGIYILLAIAFRSYAQPALIMIAIPFAYAGAVFGHLLFGMPFALFSFFGVGAAAGVVINDNLVMVDFVNRLRANGVGAFQALVDAGVQRFRPIILTSVTTFLGILPMMTETSTQAQFLKPMVVALGFAVVFALFLTLLLVPALYAIGVDIKRGVVGMWTGQKLPGIGSSYHETEGGEPETDVGTIQPAE